MFSKNSSVILGLGSESSLQKVITVTSSMALCGCLAAVVTKLVFFKVFPKAWKCCLLCQDVACLLLSIGLLLVSCHVDRANVTICRAGGFFITSGILDIVFSLALTGITLILVQNPTKMSQLSTFRWKLFLSLMIPPKIMTFVLAALPVSSLEYFDTTSPYSLVCFPVRQEGKKGAAFGAILIFIMWGMVALALTVSVVLAARFWAGPGTRVHASTPSLWQIQKMEQSRTLHKFSMLELALIMVTMLIVTIVVYTNNDYLPTPQWVALLSLAAVGLVHVVVSMVQLFLWSGLCCDRSGQKKEPHHRLKQLELIRTEGAGKLRLKVTWAVGKGVWKRGLLKVYGPAHIKSWAQEIVVLGLLRKSRSASVLQCLWTSNTNPYYETMTLLSGDIVTSDSRLTCLELTSSGTLQDLLKTMEIPLPESCQRTIMRDIAEGLSCLHDQNVLHRNLTSAAVYLKGSVQRLMLRAAIGDFEDSQIYGTLLTGSLNSTVSKKRFFFPDIRAYALVGIEMLTRLCESRQRDRQLHCGVAIKSSLSLEDTSGSSDKMYVLADQNRHLLLHDQTSNKNMTEIVAMVTDARSYGAKRFDNPDVPYCAPGEPEYGVSSKECINKGKHLDDSIQDQNLSERIDKERTKGIKHSASTKSTHLINTENSDNKLKEYNIDSNWKLQARAKDLKQKEDMISQGWSETAQAVTWKEYEVDCGVSHVKKSINFTFPNYSIFRTLDSSCCQEDLDMIEEDIDQCQNIKFGSHNGHHKQAGYVSSVTDDGREIFIPATYKLKKSGGNSSSGYGSCSGSTIMQTDHYSSAGTENSLSYTANVSHVQRFNKTTKFGTTASVEDDILQVLPAVGDSDYTSTHIFKELLKAKEDERTEQLIASYEERVRKGQSVDSLRCLLAGIVYPRQNLKTVQDTGPVPDTSDSHNWPYYHEPEQIVDQTAQHQSNQTTTDNKQPHHEKLVLHRQKADTNLHLDVRGIKGAIKSSFQERSARSSLRRNKARLSLKKALGNKNLQGTQQLSKYQERRGMKGKEVEQKYSSQHRVSQTKDDIVNVFHENVTDGSLNYNNEYIFQTGASTSDLISSQFDSKINYDKDQFDRDENLINQQELRKLSAKSRLAPQSPVTSFPNFTSTLDVENVSTFDNSTRSTQHLPEHGTESVTSVEPASTESEYTHQSSIHSHEQTSADKIESDMNDIIEQSNASYIQSGSVIPLGIRLIDSGFDSVSVSSEESCVCAAAALQIPEEGSTTYTSDTFSQDRCSCACSNCLGSAQGVKKEASWPDSPDSESWNNSNSFSSYENNMHRRHLPRMKDKENTAGCVLAPDDQYPSPVHRSKAHSASSLHSLTACSIERTKRLSSHSMEQFSSSASEASSSASRCYRELLKRGVPLRVSVISGENNAQENINKLDVNQVSQEAVPVSLIKNKNLHKHGKSKSIISNELHNRQYKDIRIESTSHSAFLEEEDAFDRCQELSPIPSLEEIIKEIPDETGCYSEETKAFLNRPDSELSIKALKEVLSRHDSATDGEQTQHSELITEKRISQHELLHSRTFEFYKGSLETDISTVKNTDLHSTNATSEPNPAGVLDLLSGMDGRHVKYCQIISDGVSLVTMDELLPANPQTFDKLVSKLQHNGRIGLIGNQILQLIKMCWLNESPPTTAAIVTKLTDHVMETEL